MRRRARTSIAARHERAESGLDQALQALLALFACLALALGASGAAQAIVPPEVDDGALPRDPRPAPPDATEARQICAEPRLSGIDLREPPTAQRILNLPAAWEFSRGFGQKVAVIDTGVNRHPRLAVQPGGDFVSDGDGLDDCDAHGTLVAGIIAAQPRPAEDAFAGVAPDAEIIAIRQFSLAYEAKDRARQQDETGAIVSTGYGNVATLASAVVHAVNLGATVINISEVACAAAGADIVDGALGAAVKFAYDRNVVVVAAAGNFVQDGSCKNQNGSGWGGVQTIASPAWFDRYVLSVASVNPDGAPSDFSLHGPWVGVAAPGTEVISLDSKPGGVGLVNEQQGRDGFVSIDGTSFAAPYVAGLAALVRSRFPELSAAQVIDRIVRTAHAPGDGRDDRVGHGLIDPVAALTAQLPDQPVNVDAAAAREWTPPPPPPAKNPLPRKVATIGAIACVTALLLGLALSIPFSRNRKLTEDRDY